METFNEGDLVVCKPGFNTDGGWNNEKSGGAGYKEGEMRPVKFKSGGNSSNNISTVIWDFISGKGVFLQAVRKVTREEAEWFHQGIRNINDIPIKKSYTISYINKDDETKKTSVEEYSEQDAISRIEDFKSLNYIIG